MDTKTQTVITHAAEETRTQGAEFSRGCQTGSVLALQGELGAGKTTFVQGFLAGLGAEPPYPSPTFILMHQYDLPDSEGRRIRRIYHVDAYRVDARAFENVGWDEWLHDPEGIVLVEWPERISELLPEGTQWIRFFHADDGGRRIEH